MAEHRWGSSVWNQLSQVSVTGKNGLKAPVDVTKDGIQIGEPAFEVTSAAKASEPGPLRRLLNRLRGR